MKLLAAFALALMLAVVFVLAAIGLHQAGLFVGALLALVVAALVWRARVDATIQPPASPPGGSTRPTPGGPTAFR